MNETFKPGDVVRIIGTNVLMTVDYKVWQGVDLAANPKYACVWFDKRDQLQRAEFSESLMVRN